MNNEEMVSKANGYCKNMKYEKGDQKYAIAWLAYMAGISQSDGQNISVSTESLKDLLVDVHAIFAGWMNDECWTDWDESVRKRVVDMQYELQSAAPAQPQCQGEESAWDCWQEQLSANLELNRELNELAAANTSLQSELNALREQVGTAKTAIGVLAERARQKEKDAKRWFDLYNETLLSLESTKEILINLNKALDAYWNAPASERMKSRYTTPIETWQKRSGAYIAHLPPKPKEK